VGKQREWRDRIVIEPDLHHGEPCIRGTRIPVTMLIGSLADGMSIAEILTAYPQLTEADLHAALAYAAEVLRQEIVVPFSILPGS
jgi:uncharacterized protein (DUF433 family)